ncbi:DUF1289 domain-containing protein [Rhodophyticola porphyridii]|uniref:DUF1289 domain-containing protein n=1 Tax=Rhodophyticola porphyridii TaxID=1852017 RepID=A0A3L9XYT6_9RHOB|nr:DUF1289 domain-containing protein [Rhodophyticola porphyridii]RMA41694.1 DUF1289 domain-containing protein [Rhodophyticola porphyridii]
MSKYPSPCIDVCKFRRGGHCIGCSMTEAQKSMYKTLSKASHQEAFIKMLIAQQDVMGKFSAWEPAYLRKCKKKKAKAPLGLGKQIKGAA